MFCKDFQGSSRFSENVQYKAVYHSLTPSEINAGKAKLCKFRSRQHVKIFTASRRDANWCGVKNFFFSISLSTVSEMNYLSKWCFVKIMKRNLRDYIYNFHCKSTGKNSSKDQNSVSCAKKIEGRGSSTGKLPSVGGGGGYGVWIFS